MTLTCDYQEYTETCFVAIPKLVYTNIGSLSKQSRLLSRAFILIFARILYLLYVVQSTLFDLVSMVLCALTHPLFIS